MADLDRKAPLGSIADRLKEKAESSDVSVDDMMDTVGRASYGPLLLLLALITITPIGSIPGASVITGIILVAIGGHMLFGSGSLWIPGWIERRSVGSDKVRKGLDKSRPVLDRIDRVPRPRMQKFLSAPWTHATGIGVAVMGVLMFPLAVVPWGVMAPGIALLVVGLGLTGRDGLLLAAGLTTMAIAGGVSLYLLFTQFGG